MEMSVNEVDFPIFVSNTLEMDPRVSREFIDS